MASMRSGLPIRAPPHPSGVYGYYASGPYYQPAPSALLPQPLPEPCMLPHHLSIRVPHGQVKVLIHNPDTPQDLPAFSEHRSAGKSDPSNINIMGKITNDNNNNNNGSIRNNLSKSNGVITHSSSQTANSKRASEKTVEKSSAKSEGSKKKEPSENKKKENGESKKKDNGESKKKDSDSKKKDTNEGKKKESESNKKKDSESNKNSKNGESNKKKGGESGKNKESEKVKKKDSHVVLKTKDSKESKAGQTKQPKKKSDKKKKASEMGSGEDMPESKEEIIPEHGWVWVGEPETKKVVSVHMDQPSEERQCYKAIKHSTHGDVINARDCVLLRSGGCRSDVPYVAKVGAFWEHPKTKEMMMSLLWYYQPEHTEPGRQPHDMENEVFASRHRDENSVACIDDKCYVLTFDQYCRYQAEMRRIDHSGCPRNRIVPEPNLSDPEIDLPQREMPDEDVDPANIFCCRKVYDFRMKRILKNPS